MKTVILATLAAIALFTLPARADSCAKLTNLNLSPNTALKNVAAGFIQWRNAGSYTCSGTDSALHCAKGSTFFNFYLDGNNVFVYDLTNTWTHTATFDAGYYGAHWHWESGHAGYLTATCTPVFPDPCGILVYGTCD